MPPRAAAPPPPPEPPIETLAELLATADCADDHDTLHAATITLEALAGAFEKGQRVAVLALLKEAGVDNLKARQAIATALTKAIRTQRLFFTTLATVASPMKESTGTPAKPAAPPADELFALAPSGPLRRRPRIAMLHGGFTNGDIFKRTVQPLLETRLAQSATLVFLDAGHELAYESADAPTAARMKEMHDLFGSEETLRYWSKPKVDARGFLGFPNMDADRAALEAQLKARGPFDLLVGFSQGANLGAVVAARAARQVEGACEPFRGLVLLEATLPGWAEQAADLFRSPLPLPAVVVGATKHQDDPRSDAASEMVCKLFADPIHLTFAEGHKPLPTTVGAAGPDSDLAMIVHVINEFVEETCPSERGSCAALADCLRGG